MALVPPPHVKLDQAWLSFNFKKMCAISVNLCAEPTMADVHRKNSGSAPGLDIFTCLFLLRMTTPLLSRKFIHYNSWTNILFWFYSYKVFCYISLHNFNIKIRGSTRQGESGNIFYHFRESSGNFGKLTRARECCHSKCFFLKLSETIWPGFA